MQHSDPQESKDIHSVAAPGGCALGSLGAGASKPPKTRLPKAEPFPGGGWGFALLLTPPYLSHGSPTSRSWCRVRGDQRKVHLPPSSPRGVSARRFLGDVESGSLAPKAMDASLPGLRREHRWPWGRWDLLGWVVAASFQWSLANISYLVSEVNNA